VDLESRKLAAAAVLLSPFVPLIFMGEEYGETAPFHYFVSHGDPDLVQAVREGRRAEFAEFQDQGEPPDPQAVETFLRSRIDPARGEGRPLARLYRELIALRREHPVLRRLEKNALEVNELDGAPALAVRRWHGAEQVALLLHFGREPARVPLALPDGRWRVVLNTADAAWGGPGGVTGAVDAGGVVELASRSALLLERQDR
jgi:maltooligosyltrehalose trehalohydrolase